MSDSSLFRFSFLVGIVLLVAACQTAPSLDADRSASTMAPEKIDADTERGQEFLWGGQILEISNLTDRTEITILSYPLASNHTPNRSNPSTGRFIAVYPAYLEPLDYAPKRLISIIGTLSGFRDGKVSGASYTYPQINVTNLKLHRTTTERFAMPFSIGVGIGL